jgi:hypothetical protein
MPAKTNEELYQEAERALIGEAIAETEQEIHDSAFDNAPDDNDGDTSLEEMDSDDVVDDDVSEEDEEDDIPEEGEGEYDDEPPPEKPQPQQEERQQRGIPPGRLREEAEARRAAEAEARELRVRIEALERNRYQQPPPQQQPPQQQGPDMFADPEGWAAAERTRIMNAVQLDRVNMSLADAAEQHGDKFQEAYKAINSLNPQSPADMAHVQRIWNAPNPGRELMKWHQQQSLLHEIGNDPTAYRQKLRDELLADPDFRKELISGMRNDAVNGGNTRVRLPPSLNGATGGTSHRGRDGRTSRDTAATSRSIEREIFDSAFDD